MVKDCVFCQKKPKEYLVENEFSAAFFDFAPVTQGHTLVIPKRHVEQIWELRPEERQSLWKLIEQVKQYLDQHYQPGGYNLGVNAGAVAGQSVMHCHIHVIPRYANNATVVPGVENLIPPAH